MTCPSLSPCIRTSVCTCAHCRHSPPSLMLTSSLMHFILVLNGLLLLLLHTVHLFNGFFSMTTWVSRYQQGKACLDLHKARDDGVSGWQWHQLDHMQTTCTLLQTYSHTNTSSPNFCRLDALADAQPTVSKHWRHLVLNGLLNVLPTFVLLSSKQIGPTGSTSSSSRQSCLLISWRPAIRRRPRAARHRPALWRWRSADQSWRRTRSQNSWRQESK